MRIILWSLLGVAGLALIVTLLKLLDRLLLRAEEKGWIYYRKKSAGGTISGPVGAGMAELDRFMRPAATEHRIQAENPIVEEDKKGGK